MTAAQTAKHAGLNSLNEMSELSNVQLRTLRNWHKNNHQLFNIVAMGCVMLKKNCEAQQ